MNRDKKITMWVQWSDDDAAFLGYCPQFFPYGAVCHGHTEAKVVSKLAAIVRRELDEQALSGKAAPPTRRPIGARKKSASISK
jgi:hypothetical protein